MTTEGIRCIGKHNRYKISAADSFDWAYFEIFVGESVKIIMALVDIMTKKKKEKTAPATENQPLITQKPKKSGKGIWIFISITLFLLLTLSISFTG